MDRWKTRQSGGPRPALKVKRLDEHAIIPTRGTKESAGIDLYCTNTVTLFPGDIIQMHTGIAVEIPSGYYGHLTTRSSLGKKGVRVSSGCTVIDSDYRGEVLIYMTNDGIYPYPIHAGDRVAQMVVQEYTKCDIVEVDELSDSERGTGGFGSTGR